MRFPINLTFAELNDGLGSEDFLDNGFIITVQRHEGNFTGSDVLCMTLEEPTTLSWFQWAMDKVGEPANIYYL